MYDWGDDDAGQLGIGVISSHGYLNKPVQPHLPPGTIVTGASAAGKAIRLH